MVLTGDWRKDIQLGYRENERDFVIGADGSVQGYAVYGDRYGDMAYEAWDVMFVSFCAS